MLEAGPRVQLQAVGRQPAAHHGQPGGADLGRRRSGRRPAEHAGTALFNTSTGTSASTNDGKRSGNLSATYKLDAHTNLYARYANGFRASPMQNASAFAGQSQASPEAVNSYSVGFKSELRKRTLRLSGSLFSYTVKDLQLTAVGGSAMVDGNPLPNAPKWTYNLTGFINEPRAYGVQLEAMF